jgi:galactose mutarotase-like enzyme
LNSEALSAQIDPRGAQLSILRDSQGRDLLWNGDPSIWAGRAPVLFPIVGELAGGAYHLGSQTYHLSRHGFARTSSFQIIDSDASAVTLRLQTDEVSLRRYPFHFELDLSFALRGPTLTLTTSIRNLGDAAMPASFGYHPAFRWPLPFDQPRQGHYLEFDSDEPAPVRRLDPKGLLEDALFQSDAVIFDALRSQRVTYGADTGPRIAVSFPDTPFLGVWTKPGAHFICIEPWHGIADPQGFSGDFSVKPGIFMVAPGGRRIIKVLLSLIP